MKIKSRVKIHCVELSPYNNQIGTVTGTQTNVDKAGSETIIYFLRLDKPHRSGFEIIGLPYEALELI